VAEDAVWNYPVPLEDCVDLGDYVAFSWDKMDAWFEEDEEVFVHAKDPYKRMDSMHSSRHVRVEVNGETVAETDSPVLMIETGLPHRYYIPKRDVRLELLRASDKVAKSPYKGEAAYFSVEVGGETVEDLAWYYKYPLAEAAKVANYVCFPQGKVDMYVDGELEKKPKSRWD
jgi:uncharacterized protein (DUF427 family)